MLQDMNTGVYGSVAEFLHATLNDCRNTANRAMRDEYANDAPSGGAWYGPGIVDGKHIQRLMREGWPEGNKRIAAMLAKIDTSALVPIDRRRRLTRTDMGDALDMHAVYAGRLDTAWTVARRRRTTAPQKIDILANMICCGGDSADTLFTRGACAVALCDALEHAGYMVRLVVGFGDQPQKSDDVSCRITVKDYDMPMDTATAASVTLPGFFRGLGHAWIAGHDKNKRYSPSIHALGHCVLEPGEIMLSHDVRDNATAEKWLQKTIARLNSESDHEETPDEKEAREQRDREERDHATKQAMVEMARQQILRGRPKRRRRQWR